MSERNARDHGDVGVRGAFAGADDGERVGCPAFQLFVGHLHHVDAVESRAQLGVDWLLPGFAGEDDGFEYQGLSHTIKDLEEGRDATPEAQVDDFNARGDWEAAVGDVDQVSVTRPCQRPE